MTGRERLQAIFQGDIPDRPAIKLWGAEPKQKLLHSAYRPVLELALAKTDIIADVRAAFDPCWGAMPPPTAVEEHRTADGRWLDIVTKVQTPAGMLRHIRRNPVGGGPGYEKEYLIKKPSDLEKLLSVSYVQAPVVPASYQRMEQVVGDRGITLYFLFWGDPAYSLLRLIGSENFSLWMYDDREILLEMIRLFRDRMVVHVTSALAAGIRGPFGWGGPELFVPPLMSPASFDEFVVPFDKSVIEAIHDGGGRVWVHSHGKMRHVLQRFADIGVDVLNPIEPPPMGDVTLSEAFEMVGNQMALEGNIEEDLLFRESADRIREMVRAALQVGKGKRFILCLTDYYSSYANPPPKFIKNQLAFIEEASVVVGRHVPD